MTLKAKIYIGFIITLGAVAIARGFLIAEPRDFLRFACYLALAVPASCLKVRLPGVTGTISVLFVFLLASIAELGLADTLLIGMVCVVFQSIWRAKVRPRAVQIAFSAATIAIAVTAAYYCYQFRWLPGLEVKLPFRLGLSATVFFLTNTFPVAVVIALTESKSIRQVWKDCYVWSFPYYLVGAAIVGMFGFANRLLDWEAWILILPVVYVIYRSYHLYLDRLESQQNQTEDQRRHADEVANLLGQAMAATNRLDAVIQASPLAIFAVDRQGNVTSWNSMAERIFGWNTCEVLGRQLPQGGDSIRVIVERTLNGEALSGIELAQLRKDGSGFEAALWTAPLSGPEPGGGILLTVADVSDRKRLEEQLRTSQKMEAIGRLAGGIAHDFNNLLTIVNGYSSMLMDHLRNDPYGASQAEEILKAGNRAGELVSQLLSFSRRQMIKPVPIDINQFIHDLARMLRRLIGEHIELRTVCGAEAGIILADYSQMTAIMMNLVTNARDAMPDGGVLTIGTARIRVEHESTDYPDLDGGDYVRLTVSDTGLGMDEITQQHLFEPFFTTKERGKGTGLGLSSVYGSIQQNRGRISVDSQIGKGTEFTIWMPSHCPVKSTEQDCPEVTGMNKGTETILLVEDESALRRMLREALRKAGYRVWEAGNGAEALQQWDKNGGKFDLVVTDIVMPVMNGLRLAQELRKNAPDLLLMFISGHSEDVIVQQGVRDSRLIVLAKPFLPQALVHEVRQVLDRKNLGAKPLVV